jgi:trigger factor
MQTTIEETEKHKVKLTIEVPTDEYSKDVDRAYRAIANSVRIPGFRKGKAPRQIIDTQIGREAVVEQFVRDSLFTYYMEAVREHDLAPIDDPDISLDDVDFDQPLQFTAEVEIRPRLTLDNYKGLKVERPPTDVTEEEIAEYLDRLRDRFAELETVERGGTDGDYSVIDIRGTFGEEEVPEATQADFLYEIGTGLLEPKLDEEIRGKKKGDILKFDSVLPEGFGERSGDELMFSILVKEIKSKKLPELDDEFAKTASEFDTLDELKADLQEKIGESKGREADGIVRERTLTALVELVDVDLPERLVEEETERRMASATQRYSQLGLSLEAALEEQGWDEERFRADAQEHALRAIKADLALESVSRQEEIQVTPEELAAEIGTLAQAMGRDPKSTAKALNDSGQVTSLAADIIRSKALDIVVESAEVVPGTAEEAADPAPEGEEA